MKRKIYTVMCSECEEEMAEGDKLQIESWARRVGIDDSLDWSDAQDDADCPVYSMCMSCARMF